MPPVNDCQRDTHGVVTSWCCNAPFGRIGSPQKGQIGMRVPETGEETIRRDRLLASLVLIAGVGLLIGLPFALRAGKEFFLPLTAAVIIAIALVPLLEWLERRGLPPMVASSVSVLLFLVLVNAALAIVVVPAIGWFIELPTRVPRITSNLAPILDFYEKLQRFVDGSLQNVASGTGERAQELRGVTPSSLIEYVTTAAPAAAVQLFFAILVVLFFLAGWTRMRRGTITSRGSFDAALETARVLRRVVDNTSSYLVTISGINTLLGIVVALTCWAVGMPSPIMWGGIVALSNFIPYLGPIVAASLLALGGLMVFDQPLVALIPSGIFVILHFVEANFLTPLIVGHRLTISPLAILVSLSFWGWVWGAPGALLAVPILLIIQTVLAATGTPDLAGYLFERGTLSNAESAEDA